MMRAMLGPEQTDDKVADILNTGVDWKDEELWYQADPRHVEKIVCGARNEDRGSWMTVNNLMRNLPRDVGPLSRGETSWHKIVWTSGTV